MTIFCIARTESTDDAGYVLEFAFDSFCGTEYNDITEILTHFLELDNEGTIGASENSICEKCKFELIKALNAAK